MTTHKLHEKAVNHWLAGIASFLLLPCFAALAWLLFAFYPAVSIVCGLASIATLLIGIAQWRKFVRIENAVEAQELRLYDISKL